MTPTESESNETDVDVENLYDDIILLTETVFPVLLLNEKGLGSHLK